MKRVLEGWVRALALLALVLIGAAVGAQDAAPGDHALPEPQLQVVLEPREITAGDPVSATVRLVWPAGAPDVSPRFPAWQDTWGRAEILEVGPIERRRGAGGDIELTQTVRITAFEVGETALPPMTVAIPFGESTREVRTPDDLALTVRSVLPEGEEQAEPMPAAAPDRLGIGQRFGWTAGVLAALCLLAAWRTLRWQPQAAGPLERRAPRLPPLEELRQALDTVDVEHSETAHTAISLALRTFVGRTAGIPAVERTTAEIVRLLRDSHLEPAWCRRLATLLQRADEAKFVPGSEVDAGTTGERLREALAIAVALEEDLRRRREEAREQARLDAGPKAPAGRKAA